MKKVIFLLLVSFILNDVLLGQQLPNISVKIPKGFYHDGEFSEGLARVTNFEKVGYINTKGDFIVPPIYDYKLSSIIRDDWGCGDFSEGLVAVIKGNKYGFVDKLGNEIIPFKHDKAGEFCNGLAKVSTINYQGNQSIAYINKKGRYVIPYELGYADFITDDVVSLWGGHFSEGLACVSKGGTKDGYINDRGEIKIPVEYKMANRFSDGLARVELTNSYPYQWGYLDKHGNVEIRLSKSFTFAKNFSEGLAAVKKNGKWGFIDKTGSLVIPTIYDDVVFFSEGLVAVKKGYKVGYVDKNNRLKIPIIYDDIGCIRCEDSFYTSAFSEGLAAVKKNAKSGFINKKGDVVIPIIYDAVRDFSDGYAYVESDEYGKGFIKNPSSAPTTKPIIVIIKPSKNYNVSTDAKYRIKVCVKSSSAIQKINVTVNNKSVGYIEKVPDVVTDDCAIMIDKYVYLENGQNEIKISNQTGTSTKTIYVNYQNDEPKLPTKVWAVVIGINDYSKNQNDKGVKDFGSGLF